VHAIFCFLFLVVLIAVVICIFCKDLDKNFPQDHKKISKKQDDLLAGFLRCAHH